MFIKKGVLALLVALSFSVLSSTEHINHASDHEHGNVNVFECEYADNFKTPKLILNEQNFFMLVSHGLHHLFGYDHYDKQSRSNMRFLENTFMKFLGLKKVHEN